MMTHNKQSRIALAVLSMCAFGLVSACSAPGSGTASSQAQSSAAPSQSFTQPVTADEIAALGDVTLSVWADQGEQQLMDLYVPKFESEYPNVKVDIQFKSYNDLTATVLNAMNSTDAPDVTQGNQGWATDGSLVRAGLIRPLDDVVGAYGYADAAGKAITQLQWSEDGKSFGSGTTYGMSPDNQMVGLFYNKDKLAALGKDVPTTLAGFEDVLAAAKNAGETPIVLGNSDKASAMQAFSLLQGALTPAADTRAWITGSPDATFDTASNQEALATYASWVEKGYFSSGYDGTSPDDAAASFAAGTGVFYIGGNWNAATISDGSHFGFAPGFTDGSYSSSGSFGMPWHISSKTDALPAAVAFVGELNSSASASLLAQVNRVPIFSIDGTQDPMMKNLLDASSAQLSSNGALFWFDWATDTMFDTFTGGLQEVMAGKLSPEEFAGQVQDDWSGFHSK